MPVAAAKAEGAHARPTGVVAAAEPGAQAGVDVKGAGDEVRLGIGRVDLDGRGQHLLVQGEGGLDEAGGTGGALGVANLALHRADGAELALCLGPAGVVEGQAQAAELGDVASLGARAVGLDELDGGGGVAGGLVGAHQSLGLALADGGVDALGAAVGRRADARDEGVDGVAVALGVAQALEGQHAEAFTQQRAVGLGVEGAALT